jgi:hypothetical protein
MHERRKKPLFARAGWRAEEGVIQENSDAFSEDRDIFYIWHEAAILNVTRSSVTAK